MFDDAHFSVFDIVPKLLLPWKIIDGFYFLIHEIVDDISVVYICGDECDCYFMVEWFEIGSDEFSDLIELFFEEFVPGVE